MNLKGHTFTTPACQDAPTETPVIDDPLVAEPDIEDAPDPGGAPVLERVPPGGDAGGFRVILYDDDYHGQEEVAEQLHKATEYPLLKCWAIMMEANNKGRAICYNGTRQKCHHVTKVLREINLQCEVDCD
jgi:ATP-dependent Clp protease adapter protein ClpS